MKKKVSLIVSAVALGTLMIVGGTLAWFTDAETVTNRLTTGKVDIVLTEPAFDAVADPTQVPVFTTTTDGIQKPVYTYNPTTGLCEAVTETVTVIDNITPGAVVPKDPTVTNVAMSSVYVRVKLAYEGTTLSFKDITSCLNISPDWTLKDGYYYYKAAIKTGEKTTPLFTKVTIPTTISNEDMEKLVNIKVDAEAIQSDNILPADYTGTTPAYDAFAKK